MMKPTLLLNLSLFLLSGCSMVPSNYGGQQPAAMTFAHIAPVEIHALSVQLPADYIEPVNEKDVANDFIIPPAQIVHDYFQRKLIAAGATNRFEIELEQANMFREYTPSKTQWQALLKMGASYRYEMVVQFKMLLRDDNGKALGGKRLGFNKQFFIPVSDSIAERETRQMAILESLVTDIDQAVSAYIVEENLALPEASR